MFRELSLVIQEVVVLEKNYIQRLENGINLYVYNGIDLIHQKDKDEYWRLFANLLKIYEFHKNQLFCSLIACNEDIFNIANVFHTFITNDNFYPYVLYSVDEFKIEKIISQYKKDFDKLSSDSGDKLGIKNFLMEPMQRLPRYQMLFSKIIKTLRYSDDSVKSFLTVCCMAEKQLRRLVNTVDQAISLNDLENYPKFDWQVGQGNFRKMSKFIVFEHPKDVEYESNVYLFEKSLICTESNPNFNNRLLYRTHVTLDEIYFIEFLEESKIKITLCQKKISLSGATENIQEWATILKSPGKGDEGNGKFNQ
uniref:CSON009777 protein n=1 Tax=Culicoides sonorensis TaxID=179676 RepID=A0A336MCY0_CULSO